MSAKSLRLYSRLQQAAHVLRKVSDQRLQQAVGVSTAQVGVLAVLASEQPVRQNQLAARLRLNESAVTAMCTRLGDAGLLTRRRSAQDRRAWELRLTPEGEQLLVRARRPFDEVNARLHEAFSDVDLERLAAALDHLASLEVSDESD